jgi:FtsP/CotA-like multicopper oxidase with cupredoxin domain
MQKKVVFGSLFVILAFMFMFADAQFHIGFKDKPSMALTHASHGSMEGMDHSNMEDIEDMDHSTMDMPGMIPLEDLPPEEPQSVLEPEIVIEDGKEIKVFNLWIEAIRKEIRDGIYTEGWGFNRQVPGPELRIKEGDNVRIIFENRHTKEHTIHWHGVHVPTEMDGVPSISQKPVQPNETFTYEIIAMLTPTIILTWACMVHL